MQPFQPAWWLPNGHFQTLWASVIRRRPKVETQRERIELPDGDFLDLHWTSNASGPIVLVLHGLEGSIESNNVAGLLKACSLQGWRGVIMHFRNCGEEPNRLLRSYHAGETSDLAFIVDLLHQREPETPLAIVAISLGANVMLKWLGESQIQKPLQAAVAISTPFLLNESLMAVEEGFSRIYHDYLLRAMKQSATRKFSRIPRPLHIPDPRDIETIREFDDKITAPLHGFENRDHYYRTCSSRQYLKQIRLPTLIIHAMDDPFMTPEIPPTPDEVSSYVTLDYCPNGGHVAFVTGKWPWNATYWAEHRAFHYLNQGFRNCLAL